MSYTHYMFSYNIHGVSTYKFKQIRNYESVIYIYIYIYIYIIQMTKANFGQVYFH